jgi:hypothetical protein
MMLGHMMGAGRAPSALPKDQLTVLYALMTLLDPANGDEIERIAASLPRDDVAQAILGLKELIDTLVAMTPLQAAVAAAIEELQQREAALAAREAKLVKRETAISRALTGLEGTL